MTSLQRISVPDLYIVSILEQGKAPWTLESESKIAQKPNWWECIKAVNTEVCVTGRRVGYSITVIRKSPETVDRKTLRFPVLHKVQINPYTHLGQHEPRPMLPFPLQQWDPGPPSVSLLLEPQIMGVILGHIMIVICAFS
uniref:Uncharacterized protein n=1 Tax=Rousettus aegyptiacus TaxID=9407 RepID=A0A7J8CI78_ROUAE|nr:hypothetical protein HJG63_009068 [Rousettus aegyptiacus]